MCDKCNDLNLPMASDDAMVEAIKIIKAATNDFAVEQMDADWTGLNDTEKIIVTLAMVIADANLAAQEAALLAMLADTANLPMPSLN